MAARLTCDSARPLHGTSANRTRVFSRSCKIGQKTGSYCLLIATSGITWCFTFRKREAGWLEVSPSGSSLLCFQSPSHKTKRQQQELIAELRRRQVKDNRHVYEGKDGAIEDIITGKRPLFHNLGGPFTKDKNVYLPSSYCKCFMYCLKMCYWSTA